MVAKDFEIKNKILSCLRNNEEGLCASDIAKKIGFNRITIGKYLQILQAENLVKSKRIASGFFWTLSAISEKPKILIVDDEVNIVDLIKLSLSNGRYSLYEAFDGLSAFKMIKEIVPDLIILDLMMPNMSGDELCKKIKEDSFLESIPIIILSAKGEVQDKVELMNLGADDYITKPFDPLELEARVANKLKKHDSHLSKNPVTNLPTEIITKETEQIWESKSKYFKFIVRLNNFDDFIKLFGHKKGFEVLSLFSKIISSVLGKDIFVGHRSDYEFLLLSEKPLNKSLDELKSKFNATIPFFYPEHMDVLTNKKDEIEINNVSHKLLSLEVFVDV